MNKLKKYFVATGTLLFLILISFPFKLAHAENYQLQIEKLANWLLINRDQVTGLPHSHVGDGRFDDWAITYDSAVTTLAYIAVGRIADAKKILDFYLRTPQVWRLGGIIEAVNPTGHAASGMDWSVRTGSNLWMGMASFHLYKKTGEIKYFELAKKLADFAVSLQNTDEKDPNFGGIRLGPMGDKIYPADQHLGFDESQPSFFNVFATEHNIDAYALFNMVYQETKDEKYKKAISNTLQWLKNVGFNKQEHRLNRGYKKGDLDPVVATDIQSWGISALGVEGLDSFEPGLAEKMIAFVENNCVSEDLYTQPDGKMVKVRGADFVDKKSAADLGRKPMVSPEWTFQLINAYGRLVADFGRRGDEKKEAKYKKEGQDLIRGMLNLAYESNNTLAYPYATQADAVIGHEYNTPREGNFSTIGVAYGILALTGFDPLIISK